MRATSQTRETVRSMKVGQKTKAPIFEIGAEPSEKALPQALLTGRHDGTTSFSGMQVLLADAEKRHDGIGTSF